MKQCERCAIAAKSEKDRFCEKCGREILDEMRDAGYLGYVPWGHAGQGRTGDQKENTHETKHGTGH